MKQAAIAIGKAAKKEGLSAESAAQIAAAGAQEAAKKTGESQVEASSRERLRDLWRVIICACMPWICIECIKKLAYIYIIYMYKNPEAT